MVTIFNENIVLSESFDLRGTAYDYDGYTLVGSVKVKEDATANGYIYLCARPGAIAPSVSSGFSCARTAGTAVQMGDKTDTSTTISSWSDTASFNGLAAPVLGLGVTSTIMFAKTCTR